jgi:hypothetical protein
MTNLVQKSVQSGGRLAPIVIPHGLTSGTGLMNPSVFVDEDGDILVNLRHVNYTLYHAEGSQRFPSPWGPLAYLHPEKDLRLVTENYICLLNSDLEVTDYVKVKMLEQHEPLWEFVGLEDARLVQWEGMYYLAGVRRDTTTNGQGRMELSTINLIKDKFSDGKVGKSKGLLEAIETNRVRIAAPGADDSYCEKNWVPILDQPYHFIKWSIPTEVVKLLTNDGKSETVSLADTKWAGKDQRGSSHVISFGNYYISITHEVDLFNNYLGQKDAIYRHRLLVWDKNSTFLGASNPFSFLDAQVEFCVGMAIHPNEMDVLLSFGYQDNAAFILQVPNMVITDLLKEALTNDNA